MIIRDRQKMKNDEKEIFSGEMIGFRPLFYGLNSSLFLTLVS